MQIYYFDRNISQVLYQTEKCGI